MAKEHEQHQHHGHQHHGTTHLGEEQWAAMAENTEAMGEIFLDFITSATTWVNELRDPQLGPVRHVVDLGCGPGVAACAFAQSYPKARVTAVDSSPAMLQRADQRAHRLGVSDRFRPVAAELPNLENVEAADLVWASMALHHVGDEVGALRAMRHILNPGGLLVIAEFPENETPMTMLAPSMTDDHPELIARVRTASQAWFADMRAGLVGHAQSKPVAEMMTEAGLAVLGSRVDRIRIDAPIDDHVRRVVTPHLTMMRHQTAGYLDAEDVCALDQLIDPTNPLGLVGHADLYVESARLVVIATAD